MLHHTTGGPHGQGKLEQDLEHQDAKEKPRKKRQEQVKEEVEDLLRDALRRSQVMLTIRLRRGSCVHLPHEQDSMRKYRMKVELPGID
jgi:hypothetical protein